MSLVVEAIRSLESRGVYLWVEDGEIRFRGPKHPDNAANLRLLKLNKRLALALLSGRKAAEPAPRPTAGPRPEKIPLSFSQKLWIRPPGPSLVPFELRRTPALFHITGAFEVEAMERAFKALAQRHEILRTRYVFEDGGFRQEVLQDFDQPVEIVDLRLASPKEVYDAIFTTTQQSHLREPDYASGQALSAYIFVIDTYDYVVCMVVDHAAYDNQSASVAHRDLFGFYRQFVRDEGAELPELDLQYADFALAENRYHTPERRAQNAAYWRRRLADCRPLNLRADPSDTRQTSSKFGLAKFALPETVRLQAIEFAQSQNATLPILMVSVFALLFSRWTGQEKVVMSHIVDAGPPEMNQNLGCFIRPSPLICDARGEPRFVDFLQRCRLAHIESVDPRRALDPEVMADFSRVSVNIAKRSGRARGADDGGESKEGPPDQPAKARRSIRVGKWPMSELLCDQMSLDFQLVAAEWPGAFGGHVMFAADRLERARVLWFTRGVNIVLERILDRPQSRLSGILGHPPKGAGTAADSPRKALAQTSG